MSKEAKPHHGISPSVAALQSEIAAGKMQGYARFCLPHHHVEVCQGRDSLWVMVIGKNGSGFALRTAYAPGVPLEITAAKNTLRSGEFQVDASLGTFRVAIELPDLPQSLMRCTTSLTPNVDLLLSDVPRDLYPLDSGSSIAKTTGTIHAAQRGVNAGLLYATLSEPEFGSLLYFQNLTALNPFFTATNTKPDGVVGGTWPELGYCPPACEDAPLSAGKEWVMSDVFLHWNAFVPSSNLETARVFLDLLGGIYPHLDKPATEYHDWISLADQTLHDLEQSPKATEKHFGQTYLRPYVNAEVPDSMVQMTVLTPILEYARWTEKPIALADTLRAGVSRFYDADLKTMRRYLPNVGKEKPADEVDSWYLYHPLANLGRLATNGDADAKELFLNSMDYAIKAARHFQYQMPVKFNIKTLDVITGERKQGEPGQSDAGGLYAYVMLQAWDLTQHKRFLEEAKRAMEAIREQGFETEYQSNLTAWGVNACLRLWRMTGDDIYRDQSYVFLANFFHNAILWESNLGTVQHFQTFLGASALHDGPYMALYECFESFAAFHEFLTLGQDDLPASVRLLLTEYCKYALSRAWEFYPQNLPPDALAQEIRNGHIDRKLAFPLEDLYADGQPAGQVGQEIYGCGAAFAFVTRSYHRLCDTPFWFYCDYPLHQPEPRDAGYLTFRLRGMEGFEARARIMPHHGKTLPHITISLEDGTGTTLQGKPTKEGHLEFSLPANTPLGLHWKETD